MTRALIPAGPPPGRPAQGSVVAVGGRTMGTSWSVKAAGPALDAEALTVAVQGALDTVIRQMSGWEPGSDLSRFNAASAGSWRPLRPEFFTVLAHGMALAEDTGGAFDPCAGALVDLWGFGPRPAAILPPTQHAIDAARASGGWRQLKLDPAVRGALQPGELILDLSGIAKGYAVDLACQAVEGAGAEAWLVEVGGELRGHGLKPDGQPWWVELESPPGAPGLQPIRVALHGLAVATAGDYRRAFDHAGRSFAHTIDPRTGWPTDNAVASVSVLHPSCMAADALATALTVLGPETGLAFAADRGVAARFVLRTPTVELLSPAMAKMAA